MTFNRKKHIRYWQMCSNVLPDHYISNDCSRMTLGFFTVSALDLLSVLYDDSIVSPETRRSWIEWIYSCQVDGGGFRGTASMDLRGFRTERNSTWDPANVPATFFALAALLVLGDDLQRVDREGCITWLPTLQREDGSFGEILMKFEDGRTEVEGGRDLRYCCCAAGIAYVLQGNTEQGKTRRQIIDEAALVRYIRNCQSYNGGFGESPNREPHSGLTYCAIAALAFVQRLKDKGASTASELISRTEDVVRWMLERQTDVLEEDEGDDTDYEEDAIDTCEASDGAVGSVNTQNHSTSQTTVLESRISNTAGFNGREGKIADTCYCWWNTGALAILGSEHLVDHEAMRSYLIEKVQHMIGGFAKGLDAPPDVMHSYLGLAALAVFGEEGVKQIDPTMCISHEAASRLNCVEWKIRA